MKSLVIASLLFLMGSASFAATKTEAAPKKGDASASSTSHNFEDLLVQGKYHFSDEAVTTVEEDKVLDALIGVRSDFKDRLKSSTGSY